MYGLPVEDVTASLRTKLEHRVAPRVGQLTVADGRRLLLIVDRVHHQRQRHRGVATVYGLPVEDKTAGRRAGLEHRVAPRIGQLAVADGRCLLLIVRRVHHQ